MPIYEYKCRDCRFAFSKNFGRIVPREITEKVLCPKCKGIATKQFSVPNIVIK